MFDVILVLMYISTFIYTILCLGEIGAFGIVFSEYIKYGAVDKAYDRSIMNFIGLTYAGTFKVKLEMDSKRNIFILFIKEDEIKNVILYEFGNHYDCSSDEFIGYEVNFTEHDDSISIRMPYDFCNNDAPHLSYSTKKLLHELVSEMTSNKDITEHTLGKEIELW